MIAIVDYGMGNIHSVRKAIESMGARTLVAFGPSDIEACDKVVLPGVGAFDDAMEELEKKGLAAALAGHIKARKIFLGICLGMQLLFEGSQEAKIKKGLSFLKGSVKKFETAGRLKVPHMGWNQLKIDTKECPLLKGIAEDSYVYFCHSYYAEPADKSITAAATDYGIDFTSVLWKDNIYGVQFHPEKSQEAGLKILKNFVNL